MNFICGGEFLGFPIIGGANMLRRALNSLDFRLIEHGDRVAYLVMHLLKHEGKFSDDKIREACFLTMFHDIGAYKTELVDFLMDPDNLFTFELKGVLNHSIFSYLFLEECKFLQGINDALLFHHFTFDKLMDSDCENKSLAAKIFIGDRIDVFLTKGIAKCVDDIIDMMDSSIFNPDDIAAIVDLERKNGILSSLIDGSYFDEFNEFVNRVELSREAKDSYVRMLVYAIDFRSEFTVTHTAATVEITKVIASILGLSKDDRVSLFYGALLHDIGKISSPVNILEKQGPLSKLEYSVMMEHVVVSEYILEDMVSDEVLKIAVRHHEKLDGSGYPRGLCADELSLNDRIVAVADILSALLGRRSYKEPFDVSRSKNILNEMAIKGKVCPFVVDVVIDNFDVLFERVELCTLKAQFRYERITSEFGRLFDKYSSVFADGHENEI